VALLAAIVSLALIAVLVTGALFASQRDLRETAAHAAQLRARNAAEGGLAVAVARWDARRNVRMRDGESDTLSLPTGDGRATLRITRLGRLLFHVESRSAVDAGAGLVARRHAALTVRLAIAEAPVVAALTTAGRVTVGALASVSGLDSAPSAWVDCAASGGTPAAAIAVPDVADVTVDAGGVLTGQGPALATPLASASATYERFGGATWAALARDADVQVNGLVPHSPAPRGAGDDCVLDAGSWGEPLRGLGAEARCTDAFPVIHVANARPLRLRGPARGQGILLVDGDLEVEGDVQFDGIVVVRDDVRVAGGALRVHGALLAADDDASGASLLGGRSRVTMSSCAMHRALLGAARALPLARRARVALQR
jgi:hypothetical protein